jgi:hypothetical protein
MLGISYSALSRARAELVAAGLIEHMPQPGRQAPYYSLCSLNGKAVDKSGNKLCLTLVK